LTGVDEGRKAAEEARVAADAAARRSAQSDFATPLLVEAGAGSGKTSILVARIVAWALGPGWERHEARLREAGEPGREPAADDVAVQTLSRVVAITFTEAAAAEMAARVGTWLGKIASGELPPEIDADALPPAQVRARRAAPLRAALDRLVVRTIHAWCRRLLADQPLESGLHPRFEVDADEERTAQVVREVVEAAIPEAYPDPEHPLSWLAQQGHGPRDVEEALRILVLAGARAERRATAPLAPERIEALLARLSGGCRAFASLEADRMGEGGGTTIRDALLAIRTTPDRIAAADVRSPEGRDALLAGLQELWTVKVLDKLREWQRKESFGAEGDAVLGEDVEALAATCAPLHRCAKHVSRLDLERLDRARRALAPLLGEVERRLVEGGIETFTAILRDAGRLVAGSPRAAARIRSGIDQLLVDEFQDTDAVQCEIVGRIGLEGEGDGPTLFLVGDPRQSIYGWRSADLRAYDDFVERLERAGGERLHLTRNFRSLPAVLDEVRRCVADAMEPVPGVQPPFQDLTAHREGPGEIEHWISWHWDAEAGTPRKASAREVALLEARHVAADLARRHQEHAVPWSHMAILLRGMTDVDLYLDALRDAGVPYQVEQDRRYYQRREVIEASALLRAVLDPHDHVALVAWLRSASVGVPDAAWVPLWVERFPERLSALRRADPERLAGLRATIEAAAARVPGDLPGLDRLAGWERSLIDAVGVLAALRHAAETEPADRFVERLRTATGVEAVEAARYLGPYRIANLDQFFRDVREDLEDTGGDVSEVLRRVRRAVDEQKAVEEARPRDAADDAVRVMSVHKSKGLDFHHVYLVQLHKGHGGERGVSARLGRGRDGPEYELFGAPTPGFDTAAEQAERIEAAEQIRVLYVAMTRARDRLVVVGRHDLGKERVAGHARVIAPRRERAELEARVQRLAAAGESAEHDADAVLWRFPDLAPEAAGPAPPAEGRAAVPDPERVRADARRLAERRARAHVHRARPRAQAASELSHEAARERLRAGRFAAEDEPLAPPAAEREPRDATLAAAVGTAVHAALEHWDVDADPDAARDAGRARAEAALAGLVGDADRPAAEADAARVLDTFAASSLLERLRAIGPRIVARELSVLLRPGPGDAAVGHVVGAIDLLYRDPETDAWVVADYKSDDVASKAECHERAARYAAQGGAYVRAVREALGLAEAPRFELWFLAAGRRVDVPLASG